jgi:hypothetical protein
MVRLIVTAATFVSSAVSGRAVAVDYIGSLRSTEMKINRHGGIVSEKNTAALGAPLRQSHAGSVIDADAHVSVPAGERVNHNTVPTEHRGFPATTPRGRSPIRRGF